MSNVQHPTAPSHIDVTLLEPIRWRSWPVARSPVRSGLVLLGVVTLGLLVWVTVGSWPLGLLAAAALVVTLWRFFTPVAFGLSEYGVDQWVYGRRLRIPWRAIRRYQVCSAGVLLVPHGERTIMAPFRSLYLPWESHCDEVLAYMRHYLDGPN
ncbi:MAG: hypothetical protein RBS80_17925 [Thermoguttaceae bacterium]|jgi:hypothetical protein|nr:hypothetical protein [Thermoguttaceae bacterium]